jgi:hypothetical protein
MRRRSEGFVNRARRPGGCHADLDAVAVLDHIDAMNGLNEICGICRKIIG